MLSLLKNVKIRKQFEENVIKLFDVGMPNLLGHFNYVVFKVCGRKRGSLSKGDAWW